MAMTDGGVDDQMLNAAARELASNRTMADLQLLVMQSREAADHADHQAQQNPGPEALRQFRAASRFNVEAERALALAEGKATP